MEIPEFTERIARERHCSPELIRAIVGDCFAALHPRWTSENRPLVDTSKPANRGEPEQD